MDDCAALHEPLLQINAHIVPGQRAPGSSGACVLPFLFATEETDSTGGSVVARPVSVTAARWRTHLQKWSSKPSHLSLHLRQAAPAPNSWPKVICKQST